MAVGKSTVGPVLAARLGRGFVDLDAAVVAASGRSVADVFAGSGEAGFRAAELRALEAAVARPGVVVSLGGGTLHQPAARRVLRAAGARCVLLRARWETVAPRIAASDRPLAPQASALYAARSAAEDRCAAPAVWVDGRTADSVADAILAVLS